MTAIIEYQGSHTHTAPVADGTTIIVRGGDLTVDAPVGDRVTIMVTGSITLNKLCGAFLRAAAGTNFTAETVGAQADMTAQNGKASVHSMGKGSILRGKWGAGVRTKDDSCGLFDILLENGFVALRRKMEDSAACAIKPPKNPEL